MQDLIENYLPKASYSFQHTLSNGKRVDAIIHLPGDQDDVAIDSKFPMESWRRLTDSENTSDELQAAKQFSRDVTIHIKDVAEKYLISGETHDVAMLFLPSEAIYAELHSNFPKVIDKSFELKVMIVSPTTFMATLHTIHAVMRSKDINRLDERVENLQKHFNASTEDIKKIRISTEKITKRADKIENVDVNLSDNLGSDIEKGSIPNLK